MIDAIDLRFIEYAEKLFVESARRILVASEWLFDDDASPRFIGLGTREACFSKLLDNLRVDFRRGSEIEKAIAAKLGLGVEAIQALRKTAESFRVVVVPGEILKIFQEFTAPVIVGLWRVGFGQSFSRFAPELGVVHFCARKSYQAKSRSEARMEGEIVERRQKFSLRQVAGGAEHYNGARLRRDFTIIRIGLRLFGSF